nr:hypothetical protein [uncultured Holophaga sp.]
MLSMLLTAALIATPQAKSPHPTNTVCPACGGPVSAKSPVMVVKGHPYHFCCEECGEMVQKNPDKYLDKEGRPKREPHP